MRGEQRAERYDASVAAGGPHGLVHFGAYAMNVMRIEKGYKAWGSELTTEITPIEARIERFVDFENDFLGKEATVARRAQPEPLAMVLVYCEFDDRASDLRGNAPAFDETGNVIGIGTSGAYGHAVGKRLGYVYVTPGHGPPAGPPKRAGPASGRHRPNSIHPGGNEPQLAGSCPDAL